MTCSYLLVLRFGNIYKGFGGRMNDIKHFHYCGPVIGNCHAIALADEFVHAAWSQCCADGRHNRRTRINVAYQLRFAL